MSDSSTNVCLFVMSREVALRAALIEEATADAVLTLQQLRCSKDIFSLQSADRREELIISCVDDRITAQGLMSLLLSLTPDKRAMIQRYAERLLVDARALLLRMRVSKEGQ